MGEQYYSVRNEKTGETQAVMTKDIKKVVKAKDLKMVKKMPIRKAISKPVPTAPEKRVEIKSIIEVAMKMFGSDFVAGRLYVMDDVNEESKAGYDPEDGTIYLNLAFMDTDDSIRDLIAHELGHYIFGDPSLRSKFTEFINSLPKRERVILDRFVNKVYRKDTGEVKIEEKEVRAFIMRLNAGDNRNKFQKLLDGIKRWLNEKLGTKFKMTDRDAAILLAGAVDREEGFGVRKMAAERSEDVSEAIDNSKRINDIANATAKKLGKDSENFHNAYVNEGKSEDAIAKEFGVSASSVRLSLLKTSNEIKQELKKSKLDQVKEQPIGEVISWTKESAKKYLTKEGALPGGTYQNFVKRNSKISMEAEETRQAIEDLYKGLREIYKINRIKWIFKGLSSIPFDEVAKLNDALAGDIEITEMPEQIQEPLTRMRQHIDALSAELINTGQLSDKLEGKILDKMGVYLTRSYKIFTDPKWINKIPEQKLNTARNFLFQQTVKTNPNFTIEDADRQLRNMLNDWAGEKPIDGKRGGRLGAKDMSILMTRSDVPKQLRDVMGENTNIIFNYANTVSKISRFIADQKFLDAVKKEGAGKFLFTKDSAPAGFNSLIAPEESRTMAPLSGLRTTPEIAKAFEEFGKSYDVSQNPFLYGLAWLNAVGKANLTVGSILTQMRNLVGQPFFFLTNAHTDMSVIGKEIDRLINEKNITKEEAKRLLIKNAAGQALVGENAYAGELREAFKDVGLQTFEDMDADEFSRQFVLARIFKKGVRGAQNIYQKTDEFGKIIGWLNETKRIQKINKGISLEDASSIAAERVRNTYPTYSQSSEILRIFRRQPFIGPFATFFYETFRTTFWNLKYAFEDINSGTPEGKTEGIKRLTGAMIQISTGMFFANAISMMISGIDDQEEEDVRRMLPPWAQDASLIWFPQTKDGVYNFINFSYLNPYNAITDPFVTMMSGLARGEDAVDIFIDAAGTYLKPFTSEQPVTAAIMDASRNITETGKKVYNVEDTMPTKTTKILMHIFGKAFTPGTVDRLRKRIIPAVYGETVGTRAPEPYKEIASELTGVRFENLDMRQAFQNKAWEFNKAQNESERIFRDVATRRRRVTEEEQISAYRTAEQSRYENWQDMYRNYMAVRRAGASNSEAVRLMIDINISKREASYIARGMYVPYQVSDEVRRRVKANGNTIPLTEIRAIGKEMPKVLQDVK
jgi:transposase